MTARAKASAASSADAKPSSSSSLPRSSLLVLPIALTALALASLVPTAEDRLPQLTSANLFPQELTEDSSFGDGSTYDPHRQKYAFGRWKNPSKKVEFHVDQDWTLKLKTLFQMKYWDYRAIDTRDFFMGAAVVKLGYANDAFLYVVDKRSPHFEKFEWQGRLPGDFGITFGQSSIDDNTCTSFTALNGQFLSFCHDSSRDGWHVRAEVTTTGAISGKQVPFKVDALMQRQEALTLLFPLGNDTMRPAYVHKGAGSHVSGTMQFGDDSSSVDLQKVGALGGIDWTRSNALRCTRWKFASSNFRANVTKSTFVDGQKDPVVTTQEASIGINFSKDVYDIEGESQENAVWINGKVYVLRGVSFSIPEQPLHDSWRVATMPGIDSESVQLDFSPQGAREDHTMLLLVESDFIQPYGIFNGTIAFTSPEGDDIRVDVHHGFGVVENHYAVW